MWHPFRNVCFHDMFQPHKVYDIFGIGYHYSAEVAFVALFFGYINGDSVHVNILSMIIGYTQL